MPGQRDNAPWIDFNRHLRALGHDTWMRLGDIVARCEYLSGEPLEPEAKNNLYTAYLAKGALATIGVEGKAVEEEELRRYLGADLEIPPPGLFPEQKIGNIVEACESIAAMFSTKSRSPLTPDEIRNYNGQVLRNLDYGEDVVPGELRRHSVVVGIARSVPARDCGDLLREFCAWINGLECPPGLEKPYSILAAIASHLYLVWIHPFGDGNGRTARLVEYRFLLEAGFNTPAAQLLSIHYCRTRTEYYRQLDRANRSGAQMSDFFDYSVRGLVEQLRSQIGIIQELQRKTIGKLLLLERK